MSAEPSDPAGEVLLEIRGLRTWFNTSRGVVRAVDGVDLTVHEGEAVGLVGESGCGKTVLARSIMGLLPVDDVTVRGEVRFRGRNLTELPREELRTIFGAHIAMVFQDPMMSLHPVLRIGVQMGEGLRLHRGLSKAEARDASVELLRSVRIPQPERRLRQYPHELSGGMRQRVMLAIALSCAPDLLLADEPTTALDVTVQAQVLDLLEEQQRERQMATILASHDLGVVATRTRTIAVMYAGKIVERASTRDLFARPQHPYTEALMRCIPRVDQPSHLRLETIGGQPPSLLQPPPGCRFAPRCPYASDRCVAEEPTLGPVGDPTHEVACWHPAGSPTRRRTAGADGLEPVAGPVAVGIATSGTGESGDD